MEKEEDTPAALRKRLAELLEVLERERGQNQAARAEALEWQHRAYQYETELLASRSREEELQVLERRVQELQAACGL